MKEETLIDELKNSYIKNYINMVVDEFLAYYKHDNITKVNFRNIVNGVKDPFVLSENDIEKITITSKNILKKDYGIEIIKDNPIKIRKELVKI